MNPRYLLIYLNEDDDLHLRLLEENRLSLEFYEKEYVAYEGYDDCDFNEIIIHEVAPSETPNILAPEEIDSTYYSLHVSDKTLENPVISWIFLKSLIEQDVIEFYRDINLFMTQQKQKLLN